MFFRDIAGAMARHWYIPVALVLCAVVATVGFARTGGVYSTRTVVSFMLPGKTSLSPNSGLDDQGAISFAEAIADQVNNGRAVESYSEDTAPLYGAGIRQGVRIGLPYAGNQWITSHLRAEIEIEVVGRTRDWVKTTQTTLVDRVLKLASAQQASVSTSQDDDIQAVVVPLTLDIEYVSPRRTQQLEAAAAMLLAAVIVGGWGAVIAERLRTRRRPTESPSATAVQPTRPKEYATS